MKGINTYIFFLTLIFNLVKIFVSDALDFCANEFYSHEIIENITILLDHSKFTKILYLINIFSS